MIAVLAALLVIVVLLVLLASSTTSATPEEECETTNNTNDEQVADEANERLPPNVMSVNYREREQAQQFIRDEMNAQNSAIRQTDSNVTGENRARNGHPYLSENSSRTPVHFSPDSSPLKDSQASTSPRVSANYRSGVLASGAYNSTNDVADKRLRKYAQRLVLEDDVSFSFRRARSVTTADAVRLLNERDWREDSSALGTLCHACLDSVLPDARRKIQERVDPVEEVACLDRFHHDFFAAMANLYDKVPPWGKNWYQFSVLVPRVFAQYALLLRGSDAASEAKRREIAQNILRLLELPNRSLGRDRTDNQTCEMATAWFVAANLAPDVIEYATPRRRTIVRRMIQHARVVVESVTQKFSSLDRCTINDWDLSRHYDAIAHSPYLHCLAAESSDDPRDLYPDLTENLELRKVYEFMVHDNVRTGGKCVFSRNQRRFARIWYELRENYSAEIAPIDLRLFQRLGDCIVRLRGSNSRFLARCPIRDCDGYELARFQCREFDTTERDNDLPCEIGVIRVYAASNGKRHAVRGKVSSVNVIEFEPERFVFTYEVADSTDGRPLYSVYESLVPAANDLTTDGIDGRVTVNVRIDRRGSSRDSNGRDTVIEYTYLKKNDDRDGNYQVHTTQVNVSTSLTWSVHDKLSDGNK